MSRKGTHAGQYYHQSELASQTYEAHRELPRHLFEKTYPANPKTFGEALRKARMDAGMKIKGLGEKLSVTQDSVINWEIRGRMPRGENLEKVVAEFAGLGGWVG